MQKTRLCEEIPVNSNHVIDEAIPKAIMMIWWAEVILFLLVSDLVKTRNFIVTVLGIFQTGNSHVRIYEKEY